jgi:hypothetical protein
VYGTDNNYSYEIFSRNYAREHRSDRYEMDFDIVCV